MNNSLLPIQKQKYDSINFSSIKTQDYIPAIQEAIHLAKERVEKIKSLPASFENTIEALEFLNEELHEIHSVYYALYYSHSTPEHSELAGEIAKLSANHASDISLDEELFAKVKEVYEKKDSLKLETDQRKLLEDTYKSYTRNGALLSKDKKEDLRKVDEKISQLVPQFSSNQLKAMNSVEFYFEKEEIPGLPESVYSQALDTAKAKGKEGKYFFNLQSPSFTPFLKYCENRKLRKELWVAYSKLCTEGEYDNREIIRSLVNLRLERAKLLGYKNYAEYVLEEHMTKTTERTLAFIQEIKDLSKPAAQKDVYQVETFAKELDSIDKLERWDYSFYCEKLKKKLVGFDEEEIRPYFDVQKVIEGAYSLVEKLYGISFEKVTDIDLYHQDVLCFKVIENKDQSFLGLFYVDLYPRDTKQQGAWMTSFRDQGYYKNEIQRPHVTINCNFPRPTKESPSLLNFNEVETFFHEFGHALHGLLSDCRYVSQSGTSVLLDFVELPSQFMENFLLEKEVLQTFANHYQSGDLLPDSLIEKLKKARKFQAGYSSLRQVNFATLDMQWHSLETKLTQDIYEFEKQATADTQVLDSSIEAPFSCNFGHIFPGGYSAGYYSYKWAEVLDADAYEFFKQKGLFNQEVAQSFRENILAKGGTEDPDLLYKRFRGQDPDPKALFRRDGLL